MKYTIDGVTRRHTEGNNQEIIRKLVNREVIMLASQLVADLQEWEKFDWDEVENLYIPQCPKCGDIQSLETMTLDDVWNGYDSYNQDYAKDYDLDKDDDMLVCHSCESIVSDGEEPEDYNEVQEVYEWWLVERMAFDDLRGRGEVVWDSPYGYVWGRCTTGQAIYLDGVWGQMACDMEILEGQQYEWGVK